MSYVHDDWASLLPSHAAAGQYRFGCTQYPDCHEFVRGHTPDQPTQWQRCQDHNLPMVEPIGGPQ